MSFSSRTEMLIGPEGIRRLAHSRVAVFGVGGVGGMVCEALARAGVGALDLFDYDTIALSNLNRQIIALHSTLGQKKVEAMAARIRDINPACIVRPHPVFYLPENAHEYPLQMYSYVVDAVDTVSAKLEIIRRAKEAGVPVISAMGAGNKLRADLFRVADISKTTICPLARVMRKELKQRGIFGVKVVYSTEEPRKPEHSNQENPSPPSHPDRGGAFRQQAKSCNLLQHQRPQRGQRRGILPLPLPEQQPPPTGAWAKTPPGSISFVPAAAGLVLASEVVADLSKEP